MEDDYGCDVPIKNYVIYSDAMNPLIVNTSLSGDGDDTYCRPLPDPWQLSFTAYCINCVIARDISQLMIEI